MAKYEEIIRAAMVREKTRKQPKKAEPKTRQKRVVNEGKGVYTTGALHPDQEYLGDHDRPAAVGHGDTNIRDVAKQEDLRWRLEEGLTEEQYNKVADKYAKDSQRNAKDELYREFRTWKRNGKRGK